jgi:hypothetical protein
MSDMSILALVLILCGSFGSLASMENVSVINYSSTNKRLYFLFGVSCYLVGFVKSWLCIHHQSGIRFSRTSLILNFTFDLEKCVLKS